MISNILRRFNNTLSFNIMICQTVVDWEFSQMAGIRVSYYIIVKSKVSHFVEN